jgi:hypothetical protein
MNRCSDFIMTEGGQRVGHHLHRVSIIDNTCAPEGGEPHEPPLAKPSRVYRDDEVPAGFWRHLVSECIAAVVLVALCCAIALAGFTLALPKPKAEMPRATAKVTT